MSYDDEIYTKAKAYERMIASRRAGGRKAWANLTLEERSARAKHAVMARIAKRAKEDKNATNDRSRKNK